MQDENTTTPPQPQGTDPDEAIKNAEAQGYLRGRNEAIAELQATTPPEQPLPQAQFPQYCRRSVWDLP